MQLNNTLKFIIAIVAVELAGIIGAVFTMPAIGGWYATLNRPVLNPPNWIFGPVWTTLYFLMGVAIWLIWANTAVNSKEKKKAFIIFALQLALNVLWSIIFFGWHNPGLAFFELILLWLSILWTIFVFYKISRPAAWLLLPYIIWVSFAGYLNCAIWLLN